jgi:exodeoxyribonuclease VII large subunit
MVSTPTAAANLINESWDQALLLIERYERGIFNRYSTIIRKYQEIENKINLSVQKLRNNINTLKNKMDVYAKKYLHGFDSLLTRTAEKLKSMEKIIIMNNPERQLKLGYSIATINGKIIKSVSDVKPKDDISLKVADGIIESEVKKVREP